MNFILDVIKEENRQNERNRDENESKINLCVRHRFFGERLVFSGENHR